MPPEIPDFELQRIVAHVEADPAYTVFEEIVREVRVRVQAFATLNRRYYASPSRERIQVILGDLRANRARYIDNLEIAAGDVTGRVRINGYSVDRVDRIVDTVYIYHRRTGTENTFDLLWSGDVSDTVLVHAPRRVVEFYS